MAAGVVDHDAGKLASSARVGGVGPAAHLQQAVVAVDVEALELLARLAPDAKAGDVGTSPARCGT